MFPKDRFASVDLHPLGSVDCQHHFVAVDFENRHADVPVDDNAFTLALEEGSHDLDSLK